MKKSLVAMMLTCTMVLCACGSEAAGAVSDNGTVSEETAVASEDAAVVSEDEAEASEAPSATEEVEATVEPSVGPAEAEDLVTMTVTCDSITDEGRLYTICSNAADGENKSPAISWDAVEGANAYAVLMYDVTAGWMHWVVTDIPADTLSLEEGAYDKMQYVGPYPPVSTVDHVYTITVFALVNPVTDEIKNDRSEDYEAAVEVLGQGCGNIIGKGSINTYYMNGDHNE